MTSEQESFEPDSQAVFEPDDYLYFYRDGLSGEQTTTEVDFVVRELSLTRPMRLLDLPCGYGMLPRRVPVIGAT
ncbi:MAG: hypothetical protein ABFD13_02285 [Candidatus Cryosericum sp.]|nr:class I SAM-dependent methyltransferase [bacterium]